MPPGPMGPKLPGSASGSAPLPPLRPSAHGTVSLRPSAHGTAPLRPSAPGVPSRPSSVPGETPPGEPKGKSGHQVELPKLRSFHGTTPIPAPTPPVDGGPLRPSSPGKPSRPSSLESFKNPAAQAAGNQSDAIPSVGDRAAKVPRRRDCRTRRCARMPAPRICHSADRPNHSISRQRWCPISTSPSPRPIRPSSQSWCDGS